MKFEWSVDKNINIHCNCGAIVNINDDIKNQGTTHVCAKCGRKWYVLLVASPVVMEDDDESNRTN